MSQNPYATRPLSDDDNDPFASSPPSPNQTPQAPPPQAPIPPPTSSGSQNVAPGVQAPLTFQEECNWAVICHLSSFAGYVIPFGNVIGPLVVWLMHKDRSRFLDEVGKETLNYNLTLWIWYAIGIITFFFCIGFFLLLAIVIGDVIVTVLAAVAASKGERYRYPATIRFIS